MSTGFRSANPVFFPGRPRILLHPPFSRDRQNTPSKSTLRSTDFQFREQRMGSVWTLPNIARCGERGGLPITQPLIIRRTRRVNQKSRCVTIFDFGAVRPGLNSYFHWCSDLARIRELPRLCGEVPPVVENLRNGQTHSLPCNVPLSFAISSLEPSWNIQRLRIRRADSGSKVTPLAKAASRVWGARSPPWLSTPLRRNRATFRCGIGQLPKTNDLRSRTVGMPAAPQPCSQQSDAHQGNPHESFLLQCVLS